MQTGQDDRSILGLVGLQLYAYDVLDEGAERVVELASRAETDVLLLLASYCDADVELGAGRGAPAQSQPAGSSVGGKPRGCAVVFARARPEPAWA